jgi:hypothetical protein
MNTTHRLRAGALLLSMAWLIAACTSQKVPAEQALASVESSIESIRADAAQYFPDKLAAVDAELGNLKASLARSDYAGVLSEAPKLSAEVGELAAETQQKATAAKLALSDSWSKLATAVPDALQSIQTKLAALKNSHKLPGGVSAAEATAAWDKAKGAFAAGNLQEAVTAATDAWNQAKTVAAKLKLKLNDDVAAAQ